ncbi:MAG: hypothetical protein FWF25_03400, partial [Propionibacteriaceae bacterium]|nr:hypothetical protein [Propionibacteriaceae bacterium]
MKKSIVVTTVLAICAMLLGGVTMLASPAQAASLPHPMGLIPNPTTHIPSTAPKAANLPASADLRQYDVPVGNQGSVNSCTAWAVGYDLMGWYANHAGQNVQAFSPMYVYSQLNGGEDQGADIGLALALASAQGVDTQDDYLPQGNYNWSTQPTAAQKTNAAKYRLTGSNNLFNVWAVPAGTVIDKRTPIKTDLAAGKPVAIGMTVPASFETWNQTNLNVAYTDTNVATSVGRHAMLVVAYDANGLIIQNSWSTSWGAAGYFRLSWAAADVLINEAWDASGYAPTANTPVVKVTNTSSTAVSTLTFTPAGGSQTLMAPSNTAWKASSNASWLTVAPQTGFGLISATGVNATLTLTASSNTTSAARTGVVTFTTTGTSPAVSTSVTVTQQTSAPTPTPTPAPTLTVSPASWSPAVAGASTSVTVTSNASWSVSSSATWVSLSKTTGTGNGSVSLTA